LKGEDMVKLVGNTIITTDILLAEHDKEIRAKAIDETCLKIFNHLLIEIEWNRILVDDWDALAEEFKKIAEEIKGGAE
jgi:hypothetical protein